MKKRGVLWALPSPDGLSFLHSEFGIRIFAIPWPDLPSLNPHRRRFSSWASRLRQRVAGTTQAIRRGTSPAAEWFRLRRPRNSEDSNTEFRMKKRGVL